MEIAQKIGKYLGDSFDEHNRYRSWEHCYAHFKDRHNKGVEYSSEISELHLAFYLASWGMYRGSSFLLSYAYTIHKPAIEILSNPKNSKFYRADFGSLPEDINEIPALLQLHSDLINSYKPFGTPTDTLATKIILGVLGCIPANDELFKIGFTAKNHKYSYFNRNYLNRIFRFCIENRDSLLKQQVNSAAITGLTYPLMKLVDMYFWQIGFESRYAETSSRTVTA